VNKIKLLIADDSMLMRDILKDSILETFPDIQVREAGSGDEAQKMLQKEHFDIVLCDWEMPGLSGIDLLIWVRSTSPLEKLPFVMVTGTTEKESVVECINAGVTDYIVKPFTPEAICQKIKKNLKL
jgi:CheY-like chemotaxis protein